MHIPYLLKNEVMWLSRSKFCTFALVAIALANMMGCSGDSTKKYIPEPEAAREALQTALATWQSGAAHGVIDKSTPAINVFDMRWQDGHKLESFEIVERSPDREHPSFKVKIKLEEQPEQVDTYLVVGIDPLLIFRDIDYQKATGQ